MRFWNGTLKAKYLKVFCSKTTNGVKQVRQNQPCDICLNDLCIVPNLVYVRIKNDTQNREAFHF